MPGDSLRRVRRRVSRSLLREELDRQQDLLAAKVERVEQAVSERLDGAAQELRYVHEHLEHLEGVALRPPWANLIGGPLRKLDAYTAAFLNYASGDHGYAAQAGVRFPSPVEVVYAQGTAEVGAVSPAVVEVAWALRSAAALTAGARVLDLGAHGSTLPLSLASLGFAVTAVDPGGYPLTHPRIQSVASAPRAPFDLVLALDCLARVGLEEFQERPEADVALLAAVREAAEPGAVLALSVPVGDPAGEWGSRIYDAPRVERLLEGWAPEERLLLSAAGSGWEIGPAPGGELPAGRLLARARRR
jgi:2-polyprenyl-3-methyl-5-hydroxy-6-metoxy-1,4-benzoquinol methylase